MLGCCGAISEWAGRYEMTEKVNEQLKQELAKLGDPIIIAGCPSCMKQLKESIGAHVIGIWEILKKSDFHSRRKDWRYRLPYMMPVVPGGMHRHKI